MTDVKETIPLYDFRMIDTPNRVENDRCTEFEGGQLRTLETQMGYPIGVPIWVLQKKQIYQYY